MAAVVPVRPRSSTWSLSCEYVTSALLVPDSRNLILEASLVAVVSISIASPLEDPLSSFKAAPDAPKLIVVIPTTFRFLVILIFPAGSTRSLLLFDVSLRLITEESINNSPVALVMILLFVSCFNFKSEPSPIRSSSLSPIETFPPKLAEIGEIGF